MPPLNILLTGATGALGPQLAAELSASPQVGRVDVLVRSTGGVGARERFEAWVATVGALRAADRSIPADVSRLRLVVGDVGQDALGLNARDADALVRETDVIVHAAADTRFRGPPDDQWNVNVDGTRRLLDWAATCRRLRRLIHVSTVCVAGSSTGRVPEAPFEPPGFVNRYERTKWECERLALSCGLPVRVARVSIVMGSHANGVVHRPGALHHAFRWFGRGLIPIVPATPQTTLDLIPTETAARFLARAATKDSPAKTIWHVAAGDRAIPLGEVMDLVWEQFGAHQRAGSRRSRRGERPRIVDAEAFEQWRRAAAAGDPVVGHLADSLDSFFPGLLCPRVFETRHAEALWGGPLPLPDWRQTLERVIRFICLHPGT
jgi:nucleoside-diphosphate-sugar epimerase